MDLRIVSPEIRKRLEKCFVSHLFVAADHQIHGLWFCGNGAVALEFVPDLISNHGYRVYPGRACWLLVLQQGLIFRHKEFGKEIVALDKTRKLEKSYYICSMTFFSLIPHGAKHQLVFKVAGRNL